MQTGCGAWIWTKDGKGLWDPAGDRTLPAITFDFVRAQHFHKQSLSYQQGVLYAYKMERGKRIELSALAWKAKVLPLYEPRTIWAEVWESNPY